MSSKKIKFVFIQPFSLFSNLLDMKYSVPTQIVHIATVLKNRLEKTDLSYEIDILNLIDEEIRKPMNMKEYPEFINELKEFLRNKYDNDDYCDLIFGISVFTSNYYLGSISIIETLRELFPKSLICVGGYHPTIRSQDFLNANINFGIKNQTKLVDFIFLGESDLSFSNTILPLIENNHHHSDSRIDTQIVRSDIINDLDNLPNLDFSLYRFIPNEIYQVPIYFSRSCPYRCAFCSNLRYQDDNNHSIRRRNISVENAVNQLQNYSNFFENLDITPHFQISDPLFGKLDFRTRFYENLREINFKHDLFAELRVDSFSIQQEVPLLHNLNFSIAFGFESGSPEMLRIMKKTNYPERYINSLEAIVEAFQANGIYCIINNIVGHPGETLNTLNTALTFMENLVEGSNVVITMFFKYLLSLGSEIHDNIINYENRYGTNFLYPNYWDLPQCPFLSAGSVHPSGELSLNELFDASNHRIMNIIRNSARNLGVFNDRRFIHDRYVNSMMYRYIPFWRDLPNRFNEFNHSE